MVFYLIGTTAAKAHVYSDVRMMIRFSSRLTSSSRKATSLSMHVAGCHDNSFLDVLDPNMYNGLARASFALEDPSTSFFYLLSREE
jgi:hypothetical protein